MSNKQISDTAYELALFIENDADLYRQQTLPIIINLQKKFTKGTYDPAQAVKLWKYLADNGAKKYTFENDDRQGKRHWMEIAGYGIFTVAERKEVAAYLEQAYLEHVQQGYVSKAKARKSNPALPHNKEKYSVAVFYKSGQRTILSHRDKTEFSLATAKKYADEFAAKFKERVMVFNSDNPIPTAPAKRKSNPAPRIGTARPRRLSQITKKPPTKRLLARRKHNTDEGYFPNPINRVIARYNAARQSETEAYGRTPKGIAEKDARNARAGSGFKYVVIQSSNKGNEIVGRFATWKDADIASSIFNDNAKGTVQFFVEALSI